MAEALVEFDYKAQEPDELTIKKGDIITDISFQPGGWWEGTLNRTGKRGMFPDNFVKLITDSEGEAVHHSQPSRRCKVLFHYKPANEDELELQVGDIIEVISEVEEGWWKGKLRNRIGVFPSNFVAEVTDAKNETREASQRRHKLSRDDSTKQAISHSQEHISSTTTHSSSHSSTSHSSQQIKTSSTTSLSEPPDLPMLPPKPVKEICRAMYHYEAANADELTLQEGDLITIITKEGQDPGWWKGELKGKVGVFPDNFVQIITSSSVEEPKPDRPSKVLTTNKMRDHITKSATTSSMGTTLTGVSRKFSEPTSKPSPPAVEEKNTHTHPSVSKKPVLPPPPMKKPQRSSSDLSKSPTSPALLSSKLVDNAASSSSMQVTTSSSTRGTSSAISSSMSQSTSSVETSSSTINSGGRWTVLHQETTSSSTLPNAASATVTSDKINDKTDGILWSKHRSYVVNSSSSSTSHVTETNSVIVNSTGITETTSTGGAIGLQQPPNELDLDLVGRAAMLTHPTATRAKLPKRRPPSAVFTKDDLKNGEELTAAAGSGASANTVADNETSPTALINGDADSHVMESVLAHSRANVSKMAPWVEELKLSQAKKSVQAGKTRVMIGGSAPTSDNISSPPLSTSETIKQSVMTTSAATSSVITTSSSTATTSLMSSSTSMISSSLVGAVTLRNSSTAGGQRPQSMMGSLRSSLGSSEGLLSSSSASSNVSPQDTVTVTLRQWTELNDKLSRLELYFESQISTLTKTVNELTGKLDEEKQRRLVMQQELEKLTDLVTQV